MFDNSKKKLKARTIKRISSDSLMKIITGSEKMAKRRKAKKKKAKKRKKRR